MRTILGLAALAALVAGCGGTAGGAGRTTVVTAFYPLAWAAAAIGGPSVAVTNLTPPGAEPHDIELTPKQVASIERADVVLYLSHGFQPAVESAAGAASGTTLDALAGIQLHANADPHVWLDPVLFARIVRRIGDALGRPARGRALAERVLTLDTAYRRDLTHCARTDFVTSHAAFGYLASQYGLHQIPITGIDPESEPSAQQLAGLARLVRREHVRTVFFERLVSPKLAQTVAREAGATTAVLDPIEGLTPAEAAKGWTYMTLMRRNLSALRAALACR